MEKKIKVGILKETKTPPDRRTALAPELGELFNKNFPMLIQLFNRVIIAVLPMMNIAKKV